VSDEWRGEKLEKLFVFLKEKEGEQKSLFFAQKCTFKI
jgi:hypothetical protein